MATYIYPDPVWVDDSVPFYNEDFEKKLRKLSGVFGYEILAEPEWGIDSDLYILMEIDEGKLIEFKHCSKEVAYDRSSWSKDRRWPISDVSCCTCLRPLPGAKRTQLAAVAQVCF